ncbi:unnamed protein product [Closterium sp. Naga37s-1]|nr:unnamed protein product [Closterium sp. Naga37s-1]
MFLQYKSSEPHRTPPKSVAKKHSRPYLTVHAFTSPPHPLPSTSPPLHIPSPPHPLPSTAPTLYIPSPPRPLPSTSPPLYIPSPPRPSHPRPLPSTSAPLHIRSPPHPLPSACPDCMQRPLHQSAHLHAFYHQCLLRASHGREPSMQAGWLAPGYGMVQAARKRRWKLMRHAVHISMAHNQLQGPLPSALVSDNLWTL